MWRETLFSPVAPDLNSQPSGHNYYHHLDLTLLLCALSILQSAHRVRGSKIVLGNVGKSTSWEHNDEC